VRGPLPCRPRLLFILPTLPTLPTLPPLYGDGSPHHAEDVGLEADLLR